MKTQRFALIITMLNVVLLVLLAAKPRQQVYEKITVREFEMVNKAGVKRLSIRAEENGEIVLRMMDQKGTIRVKLGAAENGSGLVLLDGDTKPGIHALAKATGTSLVVIDRDGRKKSL